MYGLLTWRSSSLRKLTKHVVAVGGFFILAGLSASAFRLLFSAYIIIERLLTTFTSSRMYVIKITYRVSDFWWYISDNDLEYLGRVTSL